MDCLASSQTSFPHLPTPTTTTPSYPMPRFTPSSVVMAAMAAAAGLHPSASFLPTSFFFYQPTSNVFRFSLAALNAVHHHQMQSLGSRPPFAAIPRPSQDATGLQSPTQKLDQTTDKTSSIADLRLKAKKYTASMDI